MPVPSTYRTNAFGPLLTSEPANIYRTNAFGPAIPEQLGSGGFCLFANGTGTASFDSFRVTQYPDPSVALTNAGRAANSLVNWNGTIPGNTSVTVETSTDNGITWQNNPGGGADIAGITTLLYGTLVEQQLPLGFYLLNETSGTVANDSSGNGNGGTLHGAITLNQPGALQGPGESGYGAMSFDGSTAYITLPTALNGNGLTAITIGGWFNLSTASLSSFTNLMTGDATSSNKGWQLYWSGHSTLEFGIGNGSANATASYAVSAVANVWWFIVGAWDGSTLRLYVNGIQHGSASLSGTISASATPVISGTTGHSSLFPGKIAGAFVLPNTALSAATVLNLYDAGLCGVGTVANDSFTTNTSSSYTQTFGSGGAAATWTWDTANSRLIAVGGTKAQLLSTNLWAYDTDLLADFYQAENSGLIWEYQDNGDCYSLVISDSAANSGANTMTLNKTVGGTLTKLATASITFPTQTHHRCSVTMLNGVITASLDGIEILTYTDASPLPAGLAGLRNDTGTSYIYLLQISPQPVSVANQYLCVKQTLSTTDPTQTPQITDHQALISDSTIGAGTLIPSVDYRQTYVSDNFDDLNTQSNYWWQVSLAGNVIFQARDAQDAPYILQSTDIMTGTLPTVEYSGDLYRNEMVLKGVYNTSIFTQTFVGDGTSKTWNVANPIQAVPTITVNGLAQTVGIQGVDTGKQFYYQLNSTSITQDASQTILRKDIDVLSVAYLGAYGIDFTLDNTGQFSSTIDQAQMAATDGTTGIVSAIEDVSANGGMNLAAATIYANQMLQRYGSIARTITFMTLHTGLSTGQSLPIFIPQLNIFDSVFLVVEVDLIARSVQGGPQYVYTITASEAAALSSWVKYFSKVLRSVKGTKAKT